MQRVLTNSILNYPPSDVRTPFDSLKSCVP
jgi:hypothetical protein